MYRYFICFALLILNSCATATPEIERKLDSQSFTAETSPAPQEVLEEIPVDIWERIRTSLT